MKKKALRLVVRGVLKSIFSPRVSVKWQRRLLAPVGPSQPRVRGSSFDPIDMNGVPARRISMQAQNERALLYLHGGAYITGNPASHRGLMSHIAKAASITVFGPDYRLAPEHPYPAALDDALAAYQWLLDQGFTAENIFIGGDSAGGGLTLQTAIAIRDQGLPQPAGLLLISPATDLSQSGESMRSNVEIDPMIDPKWARWASQMYAGKLALDDPAVSPLFADLKDLPPTLIHVGSDEVLLDDSRLFAAKAREAGVDVELKIYEGLWHVFPVHTRLLSEAMEAIGEMAQFIDQH